MKTKLFQFSMMLFMSIGFIFATSCSSSDDEVVITDTELIGTWIVVDGYETDGEKTVTSSIGEKVTFKSDGTGEIGKASIRWSRSGNHFSYGYGSSTNDFSGTFSYTSNLLIMKGSGNGWRFEYKLKKE